MPLDQGLLASCYVTPKNGMSADEVRDLFRDAYEDEPFVELADSPPGVRDVRETNLCRIHATVEPATGRVLVFSAIDNLWKGAAGQGVQDLNLMLGLDERDGPRVTFFSSRWVEQPAHVRELEPTALPQGFRAGAAAAGLKPEALDVGVLVSDAPDTTSAARFTSNSRLGAPVIVSKESALDRLRAVVANSGGSNTGDGERGLETARATQRAAAEKLGIEPEQVGVASTGVIAAELPRDKVTAGAAAAIDALTDSADGLAQAIVTTDRWPKRACLEVELNSGVVRVVGAGEGRRHDLAAPRDDVLLRRDRRRAAAGDASSCSRACA